MLAFGMETESNIGRIMNCRVVSKVFEIYLVFVNRLGFIRIWIIYMYVQDEQADEQNAQIELVRLEHGHKNGENDSL